MTTAGTRASVPSVDDVGTTARWILPVDDGDNVASVTGKFLGFATSRREQHERGRSGRASAVHALDETTGKPYALAGERCGACRWFEARIFRIDDANDPLDGQFVVHYVGASVVPNETQRSRVAYADGGHALIETATSRNLGQNRVFITPPMARALAMAANYDRDVEHAWVNRAVE